MPTVSFISNTEYKATLQQDVGSLMFPGHLYNCGSNIDKDKLRRDFAELNGKRVHAVLIYTEDSPKFSKKQNTLVKYISPSLASKGQEGVFQRHFEQTGPPCCYGEWWWTNHPMGDVIVVYIKTKAKEEKVEGVPTKSELKTLRKQWRELKEDYKRCGNRPRSFSGEDTHLDLPRRRAEYDAKTEPILKEMFKRAFVLIQHDTDFIKRQMTLWAKDKASVQFLDGKWQPRLGCVMPSYLE